ncbi:MAG: hypothetical protein LBK73_05180, partial [Treponema sp.]|nr:hypothetical protein [Treponema sp.]
MTRRLTVEPAVMEGLTALIRLAVPGNGRRNAVAALSARPVFIGGRVDGRKYYDYDFDETDPFVLAVEGLIEKLDDAVDRSKRCPDEDIREFFERNMVS